MFDIRVQIQKNWSFLILPRRLAYLLFEEKDKCSLEHF